MKVNNWIDLGIGAGACLAGIVLVLKGGAGMGLLALFMGASLAFLGIRGGRTALLLFGHAAVIAGCYLVTWGVYLLPVSRPTASHILGRPLFWGLFSILGGVCAIFHGFCSCIRDRR